jgi:hypothetical protein
MIRIVGAIIGMVMRRCGCDAVMGEPQPMLPWYVDAMLVVLVVGCSWWALCGHGQ